MLTIMERMTLTPNLQKPVEGRVTMQPGTDWLALFNGDKPMNGSFLFKSQ